MQRAVNARACRRPVAFLALVAMLLVAVMPTISQLRAASGGAHASHAGVMQHAMGGQEDSSHDHCDKNHGKPDDCFRKCSYCDFLGHAPSLASVPYLAILLAPAVLRATARVETPLRSVAGFNAAHPRGPPSVLV
jgi:hypothetical protein